jgi:hypothetical protein
MERSRIRFLLVPVGLDLALGFLRIESHGKGFGEYYHLLQEPGERLRLEWVCHWYHWFEAGVMALKLGLESP